MDTLTVMKQSLDALDLSQAMLEKSCHHHAILSAYKNLRSVIQEFEEYAPVAWHYKEQLSLGFFKHHFTAYADEATEYWNPLYAAPQFAAVPPAPTFGRDRKDLRIADLKAEVMTLRAQLQDVIDPRWILHIRNGGIVASSIKDPLENGDYYIIKKDLSD